MKVYYAHCLAIYNTPQERRDCETLDALGFEVLNPNHPVHDHAVAEMKRAGKTDYMDYFTGLVSRCDAVAFRALPDGRVPSGVALEIDVARQLGKPVFELPSGIRARCIDVAVTREYLAEVGQR